MPRVPGQIIALGGGGFSMEPDNPLLDRFLLAASGVDDPAVLFVPTAAGDATAYVDAFYAAFPLPRAAHLSLFARGRTPLREVVLAHDLVFVGGGNTANLLALWRLHGLDVVLREALAAGVTLAGVSAGALCWFESGVTDAFGPDLQPLTGGLGFLPGAFTPHYDGEATRRPTLHRMVGDGTLPDAWAADDGCAMVFRDGALADVVTSRPGARAWRIERDPGGAVVERAHEARYLGSTAPR